MLSFVVVKFELLFACIKGQTEDASGDHDPANVPHTPAWLQEIMQELSTASTGKQIAVGSFSGWYSSLVSLS
jgi:hypothetical protein